MLDGVAQRDQAAEADAGEKDRTVAELLDQQAQHRDMIVLADEQARLVGFALAQQIESRDAKSSSRPARRDRRSRARHIVSVR